MTRWWVGFCAVVLLAAGAYAQPAPTHSAPSDTLGADDGHAWVAAWDDATRRGDTAQVDRALDALVRIGFWTPPAMAFARWTLATAPPNAVVLANGEADTIPLQTAQRDGLRPDVAVVDVPMLDVPAVARRIAEAERLPLPDSVETFRPRVDARGSTDTPEGRTYTVRDAVLDRWLDASADASLGRPLVAALTLDPIVLGTKTDVVDRGAHLVPAPQPGFDAGAARAAFARLDGADFLGPLVHPTDRSPGLPFDPGGLVLFQMLQTSVTFAQESDAVSADAVHARAIAFAHAAGRAGDPLIGTAREWIDAALGR